MQLQVRLKNWKRKNCDGKIKKIPEKIPDMKIEKGILNFYSF